MTGNVRCEENGATRYVCACVSLQVRDWRTRVRNCCFTQNMSHPSKRIEFVAFFVLGPCPACPRIQDHGTTQNAPKRLAEDSVSKYALQDQGPRGGVGRTLCRTFQDGSRRNGRRSLHSFRPRARPSASQKTPLARSVVRFFLIVKTCPLDAIIY